MYENWIVIVITVAAETVSVERVALHLEDI